MSPARLVVLLFAFAGSLGIALAAEYFPPPDSDGGWRTLTDARQIRRKAGLDAAQLERAWEFTQRCSQNGGLLVVRHGYLVFDDSQHNPHTPYSLMFEHNADGHVAGAPRDAFYKSGAGGFGLFVVPSLDLVIYKLGGNNAQYDPALTGLAQPPPPDTSRDTWKPIPRTPFNEGSLGGDDGLRRVLEMVCAAVRE